MTTVNQYRMYCTDEAQYVTAWACSQPSACPHNTAHTLDPEQTCIVDTVSTSSVVIDSKSYAGTQGFYIMEGERISIASGAPGVVQSHNVMFDLPTRVYGVQLYVTDSNVGDHLDMALNPDTTVGVLTQAAPTGTTIFAVNETVLQHAVPGFSVSFYDAATDTTHAGGRILAVSTSGGTLTCSGAVPEAVTLGAGTTQVRLTLYVARGIQLPRASTYQIGYGTMGSKPLPAGTTCCIRYSNSNGEAKSLSYAMEYTY